jgi:uncharacterized protein YgbK (DUF1537 family)
MTRLLIVADDLTGAVDAAAALQQNQPDSLCVVAPWSKDSEKNWGDIEDSLKPDVLCINTETRNATEFEARIRVRKAVAWSAERNFRLMKKVDSLLRGNVRAEIDEFLNQQKRKSAPTIFAPALPNQHRTTKNGIQLDAGVQISKSRAAQDPLAPPADSDLRMFIPPNRVAVMIPTEQVKSRALPEIAESLSAVNTVFIPDVDSNEDLENLFTDAMAIEEMSLIGSSGLLSSQSLQVKYKGFDENSELLIVSASLRSEVSDQLETFLNHFPETRKFEFETENQDDSDGFIDQVTNALKQSQNAIFTISPKNQILDNIDERKIIATFIVQTMAKITFEIVKRTNKSIIVALLGGDLSQAYCETSSISALTVIGTICQGGAVCQINGAKIENKVTLILRSGGFGDHDALLEIRESHSTISNIESEK